MGSRVNLQNELETILGSRNVYFQPPESIKITYPCIIYDFNRINTRKANNANYLINKSYTVTLIHKNPDNDIVDKLLGFPYCSFDRSYKSDNLYHYVFEIYY